MKRILNTAVFLSFAWNLILVVGVVLNADYSLKRAAGGGFESFPIGIRFLYVSTTLVILYQIFIYTKILQNKIVNPFWLPRIFAYLGILSVFMNAISRSSLERLNVIPAAIITIAFYVHSKQVKAQ